MALFEKAKDLVKVGPLAPLAPVGPDEVDEPEGDELQMTLVEHLDELRTRLIRSVISLMLGTAVALFFTPTLFKLLLSRAPEYVRDDGLIFLRPAEAFLTYFQVALMAGVGISLPLIGYQIMAFIVPALTRKEKRLVYLFLPFVLLFFMLGVSFGYFVTLPFALDFLLGFRLEGVFRPMITAEAYLEFVTTILFWMGIAFETPIVIFFLSKVGIMNVRRLSAYRKYAILAAFVLAAIITPTPDPLNQALVAIPLWILYEIGIVLSRFA